MTKGQRRNEFLIGSGPDSVLQRCAAAMEDFKRMKLPTERLLQLAYQRGVADALDAEDGKLGKR